MRGLVLLALCLLAGCTAGPTLEQLEAEAMITGDWSLVEQRERAIQRRESRQEIACPSGYTAVCESRLGDRRCICGKHENVRTLLLRY